MNFGVQILIISEPLFLPSLEEKEKVSLSGQISISVAGASVPGQVSVGTI